MSDVLRALFKEDTERRITRIKENIKARQDLSKYYEEHMNDSLVYYKLYYDNLKMLEEDEVELNFLVVENGNL